LTKLWEKIIIQVECFITNCSLCYRLSMILMYTSAYDEYLHGSGSWVSVAMVSVTHLKTDPSDPLN